MKQEPTQYHYNLKLYDSVIMKNRGELVYINKYYEISFRDWVEIIDKRKWFNKKMKRGFYTFQDNIDEDFIRKGEFFTQYDYCWHNASSQYELILSKDGKEEILFINETEKHKIEEYLKANNLFYKLVL